MTVVRSPATAVRAATLGLTVIVVVVGLALNVQRLPLVGSGTTYRAEFSDAAGLVVGEEVRVAGIKVGTVNDIKLGRGKVIAEFKVKGTSLGRDTTASIEIKTVLGQHYVALAPDGPGSLRAGSTIPLARTSSPLNVVPVFQRLTTDVRKIDTDQMAQAFAALTASVRKAAPELDQTLRGLTRLSTTVTSRDRELRTLFANARKVAEVVADRDQDLARLLPAAEEVLTMLETRAATINQVVTGVRDLATEVSALIASNEEQLGPVLRDLNSVLDVLQANKMEIERTIVYARQYARVFVSVGGSGRWLETTVKTPNGFAVCRNEPATPPSLATLLDPALSAINEAATGSTAPCLPLGPPTAKVAP